MIRDATRNQIHPFDQDGYLGGNSIGEHEAAQADLDAYLERVSAKEMSEGPTGVASFYSGRYA